MSSAMLPAEPAPAPEVPGWRRVTWRAVAICGAAEATLLPPILLVAWPMAPADLAVTVVTQICDFICVGLIIAVTLDAVEHQGKWPRLWRDGLLALGLCSAVALQQICPVGSDLNFFDRAGMRERLERAGIADEPEAVRLHLTWFTVILASVSALYLLQKKESLAVEQRRALLEAQWQLARRRVRLLRDTAGAARLDPQILFDCMALSRREYLRDAPSADALLDRLIDFLRGSLSATRAGPHTLGEEVDQVVRFGAIVAHAGGVPLIDDVAPELRRLDLCPGLLLSLVQQWLAACGDSSEADVGPPLRIDGAIEGQRPRRLCLQLNGPCVEPEALLAESRLRLTDLYGSQATVRAVVNHGQRSRLDIRLELPLEFADAD